MVKVKMEETTVGPQARSAHLQKQQPGKGAGGLGRGGLQFRIGSPEAGLQPVRVNMTKLVHLI